MKEINPFRVNIERLKPMKIIKGGKSPTLNGTGYVFFDTSPIVEEFLATEVHPNKVLLELGAGYSNLTIKVLEKGVGSYTANDISEAHLKILVARLKEAFKDDLTQKLNSLKLLCGRAPQDLPSTHQLYDAIIMDKVLHFMPPDDILQFIRWAKLALKPKGRLYVTTATPYSKTFSPLLKEYLARSLRGDLFPGHFFNVMQNISFQVREHQTEYILPSEMVIFGSQDLSNLFEKKGMKIIRTYSLKRPEGEQMNWLDVTEEEGCIEEESCLAGVVVENKDVREP